MTTCKLSTELGTCLHNFQKYTKATLSQVLLKHHAKKVHGEEEKELHKLISSASQLGEWSASCTRWVCPTACLNAMETGMAVPGVGI